MTLRILIVKSSKVCLFFCVLLKTIFLNSNTFTRGNIQKRAWICGVQVKRRKMN